FYSEGTAYRYLNRRVIELVRDSAVEIALVNTDPAVSGVDTRLALRPLFLTPRLREFSLEDFSLESPSVQVFANLLESTPGKIEKEAVLGSGDGRQAFQTFKIPKSPLTYLLSNSATPPQVARLTITVGSLEWEEVPSFFGQAPDAQVYIVREDGNGDSWVQFG